MKLTSLSLQADGLNPLVSGPYHYFTVSLVPGSSFEHDALDAYVAFCLSASSPNGARVAGATELLSQGSSVTSENALCLEASDGPVTFLVAGAMRSEKRGNSVQVTARNAQYRVTKPWGHELWITGDDPDFCFKEIFIKSGKRTSLQYHNLKQETNLLVNGSADIVYKEDDDVALDDVVESSLGVRRIEPVTAVDVIPRVLHRITAVTDVLLYEVSTPHLDDVIRIQDDALRDNGRILAEHAEEN
jgi:mannose-6-phosphate isomerase